MKKVILSLAVIAAMCATSCTTVKKTATTLDVETELVSLNTADLDVAPNKITFVYKTPKKEKRLGEKNCIRAAVAEALKLNGNADVLVAPQYVIKNGGKEVTVSGYPAYYKNFRTVKK